MFSAKTKQNVYHVFLNKGWFTMNVRIKNNGRCCSEIPIQFVQIT